MSLVIFWHAVFETPVDFNLFDSRVHADNEFDGEQLSWINKIKVSGYQREGAVGWEKMGKKEEYGL